MLVLAGAAALPVAAQAPAPLLEAAHPLPGEVVPAGLATLGVLVTGGTPPLSAEVRIDDRLLEPVQEPGEAGTAVRAATELAPGEHVAMVRVHDGAGAVSERWWRFLVTGRSVTRLAGDERIATAVAIAAATHPAERAAPAGVLASAEGVADALAGAPLAHALGGPLLLTGRDSLPDRTAAELTRALRPGATVHLLGGPAALAPEIEDDLVALGFDPVRHAGPDRAATAAAIATALPPSDGAVVASATSFSDALAAAALAAREGWPILLTTRDTLPDTTADALQGRTTVLVVGGPDVVSDAVTAAIAHAGLAVTRVAGEDRYATAAAIADHGWPPAAAGPGAGAHGARGGDDGVLESGGVALASGDTAADALAGAQHAAALGVPLLLTRRDALPAATDAALRARRPQDLFVYGGDGAVADAAAGAALRAAEDGPDVPRLVASVPAPAVVATSLDAVTLTFDRPVDLAASTATLLVADRELPVQLQPGAAPTDLIVRVVLPELGRPTTGSPARLVVAATGGHAEVAFTYAVPDLVYATVGPIVLRLPAADVQLVGFHESNHDGAQQQDVATSGVPTLTLPSRNRGTPSRSAADVVAAPDAAVLAPVTGTVLRAGTYVLYCDHTDHYVVIEPDARPGWEVNVLHFVGLRVAAGDRVVAGSTVVGDHPRVLPFRSQVDFYTDPVWPHLHVEVVDPSIPDRPGGPC